MRQLTGVPHVASNRVVFSPPCVPHSCSDIRDLQGIIPSLLLPPVAPAEAGLFHDVPTIFCLIMSHLAKLGALTDELVESVTAATGKVGASICAPRNRC